MNTLYNRFWLFIVCLVILLAGCRSPVQTPASPTPTGEAISWVILDAQRLKPSLQPWLGDRLEGDWMPTSEQVLQAEAQLPGYIEAQGRADLSGQLGRYRRQYLGLILDGRRILYMNAFCRALPDDRWREELIFVLDGGDCYFQAEYDMEKGVFIRWQVQGEA